MAQKSSKKQEIEFSAAEIYRFCGLNKEEDVLKRLLKSEKKNPRPSPASLDSASSTCNKETTMSSSSMMKLSLCI